MLQLLTLASRIQTDRQTYTADKWGAKKKPQEVLISAKQNMHLQDPSTKNWYVIYHAYSFTNKLNQAGKQGKVK